jgi:hypothetical protein
VLCGSVTFTLRRTRRGVRRRLLAVGLLLALMQPALAYPYTLEQLLAMPIERLLEIPCKTTWGAR